jgi:hypothetical protein
MFKDFYLTSKLWKCSIGSGFTKYHYNIKLECNQYHSHNKILNVCIKIIFSMKRAIKLSHLF